MTAADRSETAAGADDLTPNANSDAPRAAGIATEPTEPAGKGADTGENGPGREAAKYRRQLRAVESERDDLQVKVEALQRAEVERLAAAQGLARPAAIWASDATLATWSPTTEPSTRTKSRTP